MYICCVDVNRSIAFHPEGACLYAAADDLLKVYGWEPARTYDSLHLPWGRATDIAIAQNQLVGGQTGPPPPPPSGTYAAI